MPSGKFCRNLSKFPELQKDLSDENWGSLSDPEFNYEVSLVMSQSDIDKGFDDYLSWNIFEPKLK